jgi:hypothetical protein
MSHLSLRKRCVVISKQFNLPKFNMQSLRNYYFRYGVRYKRPDYRFWKSHAENRQLKTKQHEFV